ncbi:MAG: adenosine deaminase [Planctomycetes bacterium]|nr:adenosine deaminase [Planctomycetota bacterium]
MPLSLEACRALPKVDLHCHLDGAIRPRTILDLAAEQRHRLPTTDPVKLEKYLQVPRNNRSLRGFLAVFDRIYPMIRTSEAIERIAEELCEDQAGEGVCYFETRFAPALCADSPRGMEAIVRAALRGLKTGGRRHKVDARLILCILRPHSPERGATTVKIAKKFAGDGLVGVDLAGDEDAPAAPHRESFEAAADAGLGVTIHAGEAGPPENIREAIFDLKATRIGHGVALGRDPELVWYAREQRIAIEMCLTSNLQTSAVRRISAHPFPSYDREGLRVTLNTDDPAISGITLSGEWALAAQQFGTTSADFERYTSNAIEAAFCPERNKKALRKKIAGGFARGTGHTPVRKI